MKVFISADIEGTAGITAWDEAKKGEPEYLEFREYMTDELVAACEGARAAGADEVVVKDAHSTARNLILSKLPAYVSLIRGWSGHPDEMMFGIDKSFSAALYVGYHSKAGADANPLAHTLSGSVSRLLINGEVASEFTLNSPVLPVTTSPQCFLPVMRECVPRLRLRCRVSSRPPPVRVSVLQPSRWYRLLRLA